MNACFCSGPRPGHTLCPCRERNETNRDRELRHLREEVAALRRRAVQAAPVNGGLSQCDAFRNPAPHSEMKVMPKPLTEQRFD